MAERAVAGTPLAADDDPPPEAPPRLAPDHRRPRAGALPGPPADVAQDDVVRHLVQALVRRVVELGGVALDREPPLLDTTQLGVRCVLVRPAPPPERLAALLSPREREIARMVGLGHTNKAIATVLEISLYTVSTHLRRVFAKLGVSTRAAMIAVLSGNPHLFDLEPDHTGQGRVGT
ncbi:helix-turn-helix transcriptional regulator [Streptoalloteichus hindustanus]|uniref:Regulatory protein, luxR family n=1 Tax=Streptoalloteichus hindustanus TaxID=2017 RepID=A0A1M5Q331_STRHI|nr:helix-turn-helix transcriptional regulator [Streptoalloteichus hindustanus]SHH08494.1 regulatory protein, luxR family [Streptoalloteichus hindustanus]